MKIFIVSKAHLPRMHLFNWFVGKAKKEHNITVVTHYPEMAKEIRALLRMQLGTDKGVRIVHTGSDFLCDSRNMILEELTKRGQWYVGMDDNIPGFQMVHEPFFSQSVSLTTDKAPPRKFMSWRQVYRKQMTPEGVMQAMNMVMDKCEETDTTYGGFASMENPFFRQRKWSEVRFVKSKAFVMLNDGVLKWQGPRCGQDSSMSVQVVARYGCVAVCNWILPQHKMYEAGGIGSSEERRKFLNPQLAKIIREYPGLVQMGKGANTALRFLRTSKSAVVNWQDANGWEIQRPPKGRR